MEQALAGVYSEGEKDFSSKAKNPYPSTDIYHGEWLAGWKHAKENSEKRSNQVIVEKMALSKNKEKAIKEFSEMIAKDCAGLIEKVIEKRVRIYATHLAEIMQEDSVQNQQSTK